MFLFRRGLTAALFILLLASLSAQDVEIVVTATKEPTPAETLPVEVVVLDGDALKDKASVSEALESTLAVRLNSQVPGQLSLTAPGFGENGFGRILLLLDGFSQNSPDQSPFQPLDLIPVFALDRIEILRGPGSSVYGTGAVAGAVNLITRTPKKLEAEVSTSLESNWGNRQALAAGIPVSDGGLLVSLQRSQALPSRDRSDSDNLQVWSKFSLPLVQGDIEQNWQVWGSYSRGTSELPGYLSPAQSAATPDLALNPNDSSLQTETKGGASYVYASPLWKVDFPLSATSRLVRFENHTNSSYTDSNLLLATLEPRLSLSLGRLADADFEWTTSMGIQGVRVVADLYTDASFGSVGQESLVQRWSGSWSNRLEASWSQWFAEASVRVEASRTSASSAQNTLVNGERDLFPLSGDVGVTWLPGGGYKFGVQASRIYRFPFTDEMIGYNSTNPSYSFFYSDLEAEVGNALTLSSSISKEQLKASLSATATRMENEVVYDMSDPDYLKWRNRNVGLTYHGSSLLSLEWTPVEKSVLGGEYTYELAQYASGPDNGKNIPLVPSQTGRLWGRLTAGLVGAEAGWTFKSGYYLGDDSDNSSPMVTGRQSVDASVTVQFGGTGGSLRVFGKNLTDDRTPLYAASWGYYPTAGRTFGTTLSWKL